MYIDCATELTIVQIDLKSVSLPPLYIELVSGTLSLPRRLLFNWVLFHTRRGVRHRENLRFARTKMFGVFRSLFRAMGDNLLALGLLTERQVSVCVCVCTYMT